MGEKKDLSVRTKGQQPHGAEQAPPPRLKEPTTPNIIDEILLLRIGKKKHTHTHT